MRFVSQSICGATLALLAGSAAAQSSVTLYGVTDVFFQYLDNGGNHSYSERSGGNTGSMFGLKGTEDLGNGLKAIFDVENGFNINNGSFFAVNNDMFYRQSWVGLSNDKYGSLTFGRQYQPTFWIVYPTDPFRGNEILSPLSAGVLAVDTKTLATQSVTGRTSNSILYKSPNLGGFQFYGMYGFAASQTLAASGVTQNAGNTLDLALSYSGYGLYAALAYQYQHSGTEAGITTPAPYVRLLGSTFTMNLVDTEHYTAALGYRIGIVNLQFNYGYNKPHDAAAHSLAAAFDAANSNSLIEAGATIQATSADVVEIAGIARDVRGAHDNTEGVELGLDHNLSKRTTLYARAGYMKNNGVAEMSWPGIAVTSTDAKQVLAVLGMTHRF
jgi:general bacterial porin, GBP family